MSRFVCALAAWACVVAAGVQAQGLGTVAGQVRAEATGIPVGGARVSVAESAREVTTGADGRFTLSGLSLGMTTIVVTRDGFAPLSQPVTVAAGQTVTLEVLLPPAPAVTENVTVVGRLSDYAERSASASKTSARLLDVPQAIVVLPPQLLEDLGALDTKDLYKHMSGVTDSAYSATVVRGFTQREVLVNGTRGNPYGSLDGDIDNSGFSTSQFRLTNIERVEVLKGPSSVLYGSGEPGGVFNYITKKPKDTFDFKATLGSGSFKQGLGEFDVTGPANAARTLLYRAAVYFEDRDTFRYTASTRNTHAVGNLLWKASPRSSLAFEYEHLDQQNGGHRLRGVPVNANGDFLTDYRWTATEPTDFTDLVADIFQVRADHAARSGVRFDSTFRYLAYDRRENYHEPRGITNGGTLMQREFRDQLRTNDDFSVMANLYAPLRTGATVSHDFAVGVDTLRQDHLFRYGRSRQQNQGGPVPPLSMANPVYGVTSGARYPVPLSAMFTDTAVSRRSGAYAQDLMSIGARWNVMVGGRVDHYDDTGFNGDIPLESVFTAATGRVGVVFKPVPRASLYGTLSNGFTRPAILSQTPRANGPFDPEHARQVEVGAKSEWLDGRVQFTGAFFQAVKTNVLRPDPNFGPFGDNDYAVLQVGEIRNRGVELDLAGQILPRWNLALNYAALDSEITRDVDSSLIGHAMPNAAPQKVGLFTRVDLPRGAAVGGSFEAVGDREEPFAGIRAPGYAVADAYYFQQLTPRLRLLVRLDNAFDVRYASASLFVARAGNVPGQPRTASVQLTITSKRAGQSALP